MPDSPILATVARHRAKLEASDVKALERLINAYGRMFKRLQGHIDALTMEIGDKAPTAKQVIDMRRYKALMAQTANELAQFSALTRAEAEAIAALGIDMGGQHAYELFNIAGGAQLGYGFNRLPTEVVENLLGFLDPDGPLYTRIDAVGGWTAEQVSQAIIDGVGVGNNPRVIAEAIKGAFGKGLTSAMRTVRTVQLYAYRETARANYVANDDVIDGWYWHADIGSPRTCMSCTVQHGTLHPLSETLNDHHNGRCAMVPAVKGFPPVTELGTEWFEGLDQARQIELMGQGRFDAWKAGKFTLDQLSGVHEDEVYGPMRVEASLKALHGQGND